mgnify:FL=1|jgi:hypothetical protein|tara:strand:+ start:229 stop:516 length:288 start_codon:yes stop_codon:yes gene_type:complete
MKLETYLTDNNFEKKDLTILFTVGCVLNTVNGDTFPMMEDDTFDFNDPMNIVTDEMDDFWFESLGWNEDVVVEDTIKHLKEMKHLEMKAELHYGI